ncbi:MAG: translation initiation factor IF-2 N-terminal domain-containing protein, partial [Clostridia bacterium]|nr:translation initiation factor IF-2 N-terminal domain-containing protein [Clostridia bacterium]
MAIKKYKIHELAKDFNIQSKFIIENLSKHFEGEKKSQTALEEKELDFLFDLITKENSVKSFDEYFAAVPQEKPKAEPKKEAKEPKKDNKPADNKKQNAPAPAPQQKQEQPKKKEKDPAKPMQARTKGEMRHIDTRANTFDAEKYNEKYENIAPANHHQSDNMVKKQKLKQKSQQYRKQGMRSGKKETEAERLKRIAAERAKKPPVITVGDEITVGELASRLKMTAAEVIKKLFALGMMATVNEVIDFDTAEIVATELGAKVNREVV